MKALLRRNRGCGLWVRFCSAVGMLVLIPIVSACSWSYLIWAIRSKPADPLFRFLRNGKAGYIDSQGRIVLQPTLPAGDDSFGEFHDGLLGVKDEHGYRYVNISGATEFHTDAWLAFDFSEGLAPASKFIGEGPRGTPKWGFIDRTGQFVINPQYSWVDPFSEGLARVSVSSEVGSTGFIDKTGTFVIPPRLSYGSSFHEGLAAVIIDGPCQITNGGSCARAEFRPTRSDASYDCRYSFVTKTGNPISNLRFDDAQDFSEGLAPVRMGRQWGFIDKAGQIVMAPQFEFAKPFSEGLAAVSQGGKTGFIDHSGVLVIPAKFQAAEPFSDGRALVSEGGESGSWTNWYIDKTGKRAFPGVYAVAASFSYGLAPVAEQGSARSGNLAWINTSGKVVFRFKSRR